MSEIHLSIAGMDCASCVTRVERAIGNLLGVQAAVVHFGLSRATITLKPGVTLTAEELIAAIEKLGYKAQPFLPQSAAVDPLQIEYDYWKKRVVLAVPLTLAIWWLGMSSPLLQLVLTAPIYFWCGFRFLRGLFNSLKRLEPDMDTLIGLGTSAAFWFSVAVAIFPVQMSGWGAGSHVYFETAAFIVALIAVGRMLEAKARRATGRALHELTRGIQDTDQIRIGDLLWIKPGTQIPIDGVIEEGESEIDESWFTGEPVPALKKQGDPVLAGTLNLSGAIRIRVTTTAQHTRLALVGQRVEQALDNKPPIQKLADTISFYFVPAVLVVALATFAGWFYWGDPGNLAQAIFRTVAVLIIACPCALGLATPTAIVVGMGRGAKKGILIKGGEALEKVLHLKILAFDKTGTLTTGKLGVAESSTDEALQLAAAVENFSEHPIAKAIVQAARNRNLAIPNAADFKNFPGRGTSAVVNGETVLVGSAYFINRQGIDLFSPRTNQTLVFVAKNKKLIGHLTLSDQVKQTSITAVQKLQAMGIHCILLTGDHGPAAQTIAKEVGIREVFAEMSPEEKGQKIDELKKRYKGVGMIGDGINDALSLAKADVGFAMASGTDLAREAADITLLHNDLTAVVQTIRLAKQTVFTIRSNLFLSFIYNVVAIPVATGILIPFGGFGLSPAVAAVAMSLSDISVVLNSLRLQMQKI